MDPEKKMDDDPFGIDGGSDENDVPHPSGPEQNGSDGGGSSSPPVPPGKRGRRRMPPARKVAYSAIGAALSVVMITIAAWLPVTVAPLVLISVCYNIVAEKCGIGYGLITMVVSVALGFLCSAANIAVLVLIAVVFVPYSLLCMLIRRLDYRRVPSAIVRLIVVAAFAALEVLVVYNIGNALVGVNDYVDLANIISFIAGGNFGIGYTMVTLLAVVLFVLVDLVYVYFCRRIVTKLK